MGHGIVLTLFNAVLGLRQEGKQPQPSPLCGR
jgi:hypothetical protein